MSPVSTQTRVAGSKLASVRSNRAVLPEPGALIKLRHKTPCSRYRSRSDSAIIWFSLSTFDFRFTRSIGLHLQIIEIQFVSTRQPGVAAGACRTDWVIVNNGKIVPAVPTLATLRTGSNVELQTLPFSSLQHCFKTK